MKTLQFKTNIKCGGCVSAVTPFLDAEKDIQKWQVDTANPNKVLIVEGENLQEKNVIDAVEKAGYTIQPLN